MPTSSSAMSSVTPKKQFRIEKRMGRSDTQDLGVNSDALGDIGSGFVLERIEALHEKIDQMNGAGGLAEPQEDVDVRLEITRLVKEIGKTKSELASLRHPMADTDDDKINSATGELDAIVQATEKATETILHSSEEINDILAAFRGDSELDEEHKAAADLIEARTIAILEACNFQDITGQRITKVVNTMRFIEERIKAMIEIWGVDAFSHLPLPEEEEEVDTDEALLSGPQMDNQGLTQDDIDAMFD